MIGVYRRRVMGGGSSLPYDAEIEYLESTGTQLIDTGIKPNSTTQFLLHAKFTIPTIYDGHSGLFVSSRFHMGIYSRQFQFGVGSMFMNVKDSDSNKHLFELNGSGICKIDNETYTVSSSIPAINSNIFLFARNNGYGNVGNYANGLEIYDCQIYNDDVCVVDFIPVRVGQSGYMYDRVSGQLFGNSGTGDFVLGADKN